eukprot:CAMPEP_0184692060 /NCGR_PEP_ID=MMETSP0313-20130426/691_1 /TAXON_ID=2792 /ORGANISM="Porphyridium aerugineum, Strain SAG 1380-2" /LENGTH=302 /DNA_ID=CAMNT_0027149859 /DNA_START=55 /DNA_END=963 /DNA_ORIENTATION=+
MAFVSSGPSFAASRSAVASIAAQQIAKPAKASLGVSSFFPMAAKNVVRPHTRVSSTLVVMSAKYSTENLGQQGTESFRLQIKDAAGNNVSAWHSIPLFANAEKTLLNYVNEIPRGTSAKMEIATDEPHTPIKQDIKKGKLRFYQYGDSLINYGALPQTWEDPNDINADTKCGGDNDPVDFIEIGDQVMPMGAVYPVKVLGVLALLDEGETDWKVIGINANDPKAALVNDIQDADKVFPGKVDAVREWFRMYKTAEGKGENQYAFNGEAKNKEYAMKIVAETHECWRKLKEGKTPNEDGLWLA